MPGHYKIKVLKTPVGESNKAVRLATRELDNDSWTDYKWFAKDKCIIDPNGFVTLPDWLYKLMFKDYKPKIINRQ